MADQLREALSESFKISETLKQSGKRNITFGAFIGDTPPSVKNFDNENNIFLRNWEELSMWLYLF